MLENKFYKIISQEGSEFDVELLADCDVYEGHFPGEPISPGVCNVQMIKELAEKIIGRETRIEEIKQVRFTELITPVKHPRLHVSLNIEDDGKTVGVIKSGDVVCVELKCKLS